MRPHDILILVFLGITLGAVFGYCMGANIGWIEGW